MAPPPGSAQWNGQRCYNCATALHWTSMPQQCERYPVSTEVGQRESEAMVRGSLIIANRQLS